MRKRRPAREYCQQPRGRKADDFAGHADTWAQGCNDCQGCNDHALKIKALRWESHGATFKRHRAHYRRCRQRRGAEVDGCTL